MPPMTPNELAAVLSGLEVGSELPTEGSTWGPWCLVRLLGKGGMGWVVEALPARAVRAAPKALKIPFPGHEHALSFEGNLIDLGRSDHLVYIEQLAIEQGVPYLVMELLRGEDGKAIQKRAAAGQADPPDRLLALAKDWASGLALLHEHGWKHRDVKPSNLFVRAAARGARRGLLLDFGIAKDAADLGGQGDTQPTEVRGTLAYLAPERLGAVEGVDWRATPASDVYALGLSLVALCTGEDAFKPKAGGAPGAGEMFMAAPRAVEILGKEGVWIDLTGRFAGTSAAGLEQVIQRCLRKHPSERYPDGAALLTALDALPVAATAPARLTQRPSPAAAPPAPTPSAAPSPAPASRWLSWWPFGGPAPRREPPRPEPPPPEPVELPSPAPLPRSPPTPASPTETLSPVRPRPVLPPGMVLVPIPGTGPEGFFMGSAEGVGYSDERQRHRVVLSPFFAMEHPVTEGEWAAVMGDMPGWQAATGDRVPVASVSWFDAVVFANRLTAWANERGAGLTPAYVLPPGLHVGLPEERADELAPLVERVPRANGFRLPTEAEWEYLARGGQGDRFEFSGSNIATEVGWIVENSGNRPHDVCTAPTPRNGFGLCDLTGNVLEWTGDWYDAAYYGTAAAKGPDPTGPESGSQRVLRGGGWWNTASFARVAFRNRISPGLRGDPLGVRLVRSSP